MPSGLDFSPLNLINGSRLTDLTYKNESHRYVDERMAEFDFREINNKIRSITASYNIQIIDPFTHFCAEKKCPLTDWDGAPRYKDTAHLTASFSRQHSTFIDVTLLPSKK